MKLIVVEELHYGFLQHVFESYTRAGIPSAELGVAAETWNRIQLAREVPMELNLGKARLTDVGPGGVALEVAAESVAEDH